MPDHVLIIGAGEFGLSTALALLRRTDSRITVVDRSPTLPNPSGSSVDASRIIRPDYACRPYSALAAEAQVCWRDQTDAGWGGQGRYSETGFALFTSADAHDDDVNNIVVSKSYVTEAMENVKDLAAAGMPIDPGKIERLDDRDAIRRATGYGGSSTGHAGYVNWNSGWAHAEKVVRFAIETLQREDAGAGRVTLRSGAKVSRLVVDERGACTGAVVDGEQIVADLTVVAAGAWSPSLVDLRGRCVATGQALGYIDITAEEQEEMGGRPVVMNFSKGMFVIPPVDCELKVARHGFGHVNMDPVEHPDGVTRQVSVPRVAVSIPDEAQGACRTFLEELVPHMADRPFTRTRLCWYCDTPSGDFLIDHHPDYKQLFLATGGSGHGFKFFPVLGDKIVDSIQGKLDPELQHMWRWRSEPASDQFYCEDGSRGGERGLRLE